MFTKLRSAGIALLVLILFVGGSTAQDTPRKFELLKFSATWCGPCKQQEKAFTADVYREAKKHNVRIILYDADRNKAVFKQYKVKLIPMRFLVEVLPDGTRKVVKRWGGKGYPLMTEKQYKLFVNPHEKGPSPIEIPRGKK